jgi:hypothetical protein
MRVVLCAVLLAARAALASAQETSPSFIERIGLDKLQFVSLGASYGRIDPSQVEPAHVYAVFADYGEVAPSWRMVFGVGFWESRLSNQVVQRFLDTLSKSIIDPTNDSRIQLSRVPVYDVTFSGELRWQRPGGVAIKPYFGAGLAAHVINAEGRLVKGTFVERALDNIGAGLLANSGVLFRPYGRLVFDAQLRVDFISGFRSTQLRGGAQYVFGSARRPSP